MTLHPKQATEIILKSFATAPLLIADLPEAPHFPASDLTPPNDLTPLNFSQKLGHLYEDALAQIFVGLQKLRPPRTKPSNPKRHSYYHRRT
jgi:hypothetical protein